MQVAVTVRAVARAPVERTFARVAPIDLAQVFRGFGPLPAVRGVRDQTGAWDHAGASRVVELADGSTAPERLTDYQPPHRFSYHVGPFTSPMRLLVQGADGEWLFSAADGGGTTIAWTYTFAVAAPLWPAVGAIVAPLWRAYARRVLALCVAAAER